MVVRAIDICLPLDMQVVFFWLFGRKVIVSMVAFFLMITVASSAVLISSLDVMPAGVGPYSVIAGTVYMESVDDCCADDSCALIPLCCVEEGQAQVSFDNGEDDLSCCAPACCVRLSCCLLDFYVTKIYCDVKLITLSLAEYSRPFHLGDVVSNIDKPPR